MNDGSIGGFDVQNVVDLSINGVPIDWSGFTREAKVKKLLEVIQEQLRKVRAGTFNPAQGERVAALALEALMELSEFYADSEVNAKRAKYIVEYQEGIVSARHAKEAVEKEVRVSEASLKRVASISDEVKQAKNEMLSLEKEYKKWRYVYETLKEAHVFFRNIGKL